MQKIKPFFRWIVQNNIDYGPFKIFKTFQEALDKKNFPYKKFLPNRPVLIHKVKIQVCPRKKRSHKES